MTRRGRRSDEPTTRGQGGGVPSRSRCSRPDWIKAAHRSGELRRCSVMRTRLHTVCERRFATTWGECWSAHRHVMILATSARGCGFCAVRPASGRRRYEETRKGGRAWERMGLLHAVIPRSPRRQRDGGAPIFAACIREIRLASRCGFRGADTEFKGNGSIQHVIDARPDILPQH